MVGKFFFVMVLLTLLSACGKDLQQMFLHPSADNRFEESIALPVPTPSIAAGTPTFKFAIFGDTQVHADGVTYLPRFKEDVVPKSIDFFVVAGDLTEDATISEYATIKTALDDVGIPYYVTIGNHDLFQAEASGGWETWKTTFGPATYSITFGDNVRFLFVDTASGDIGALQFQWLETQLQTYVPYTFVTTHYPIYEGTAPSIYRLESYQERYKLSSLLNKYQALAFVGAHLHGYQYNRIGTVEHFTIGSMFPGALDTGKHGYVLFTYDTGSLSWEWVEVGESLNSLRGGCSQHGSAGWDKVEGALFSLRSFFKHLFDVFRW